MNLRSVVFAAPIVGALIAVGCVIGDVGGDATRKTETQPEVVGEPCADDPFKCKAGTTCWPIEGGSAACVPSKEYKTKGTDCELLLGRSSCADGLVCITVDRALDAGPDTGKDTGPKVLAEPLSICASWCDDKHPCATGEQCRSLALEGFAARACVPDDLSVPDTGVPDTARPDTGAPDTYKPDTGTADTGTADTAKPDAADSAAPMDTAMEMDTSVSDTSPFDAASD